MALPLPQDYLERVYAGVLGKMIGVYLGRPFEQWSHREIVQRLGEVDDYVHQKLGCPLVVADDDLSGTFTFIRALEDHDPSRLSAREIGKTWLNYIVPKKTVLWWGGTGVSTEHTAFMRLAAGIEAPRSGSIELNGPVVAEQIGAQIFIDGWGLVSPGDPESAAALARKAASVSHDGEAVHGAVVVAVMVAMAFVQRDLDRLLDVADDFIPPDCRIRRVLDDLRNCRARHDDWHRGLELIHDRYSYEKYGGGCHMIPNHAVVQLALLWGGDDFQHAMRIACTAGYDTDCNAGNVGCITAVRLGLEALDGGVDYRGPAADRLLLPTADGGGCITDAAQVACRIAAMGAARYGVSFTPPKGGARFHFSLPGSVQGFAVQPPAPEVHVGEVRQVPGPDGTGRLRLAFHQLSGGRVFRAATPVFLAPEHFRAPGYTLLASPSVYPGQTVTAEVAADPHTTGDVDVRLYARHYDACDELAEQRSEPLRLERGASGREAGRLSWVLPDTGGLPYMELGIEVARATSRNGGPHAVTGAVDVGSVHVSGTPRCMFRPPAPCSRDVSRRGTMWLRQWVSSADVFEPGHRDELFRLAHDHTLGLAMCGERSWRDYTVRTRLHIHLARRVYLAARVGGLRRWVALALEPSWGPGHAGKVRLIRRRDDAEDTLAETPARVPLYAEIALSLTVVGEHLAAEVRVGSDVARLEASGAVFASGGIALGVDEGRINVHPVDVMPAG